MKIKENISKSIPGEPSPMYKILIVEDEQVIAEEVCKYLMKWGYQAEYVRDFQHVSKVVLEAEPHLILMDINLPFFNGHYWCGQIRQFSSVPILFLSSASDNMNIVMAVHMGGDDFLAKPFDLEILLAKVQALLRRSYAFSGQTAVLECEGVILDLQDASFIYEQKKIELTKNEFKILQLLFENKNRTVSREEIMKRLWDNECFVDDNTLSVNMNRLRKKLEGVGLEHFIKTKKGMGYSIEKEHHLSD